MILNVHWMDGSYDEWKDMHPQGIIDEQGFIHYRSSTEPLEVIINLKLVVLITELLQ